MDSIFEPLGLPFGALLGALGLQDGPRHAQEVSKTAPRAPSRVPRARREYPRRFLEGLNILQDATCCPDRCPATCPAAFQTATSKRTPLLHTTGWKALARDYAGYARAATLQSEKVFWESLATHLQTWIRYCVPKFWDPARVSIWAFSNKHGYTSGACWVNTGRVRRNARSD